jgi:Mannosyltransferase (PIG-V)
MRPSEQSSSGESRTPLVIFGWSRIAIWIAALAADTLITAPRRVPRLFGIAPAGAPPNWTPPWLHDVGRVVDIWARWDSAWFVRIAEHGYASGQGAPAFYPLYPALVGLGGRATGGHYVLAGVLISLVSAAFAFVLLHRLAVRLLGESDAARAVLYLALFPMTLFLSAVYSEALFLALACASFLFAERDRMPLAAAMAALAALTRPVGFLLIPSLVVIGWQHGRRRSLAWLALVPVAFASYPALLVAQGRSAFSFVGVESSAIWLRHLSWAGPFGGLWEGLRAGALGLEQFAIGDERSTWPIVQGQSLFAVAATNLEYLLYLLAVLGLLVVAWRRLPLAYSLYMTLGLLLPLSFPSSRWPLLSFPRFSLVLFPIFIALATLGRNPRVHAAIVGTSAVFLGVALTQWALWQWVS